MTDSNESHQRVLLVEDERSVLFAMTEYFASHGYSVDGARNAAEAVTLADRHPYPVAIIDLRLKGRNENAGLEVVEHLREACPDTRIVILTAYGSSSVKKRVEELGVDVFLHKPQPMAEVAQIVFALVEHRFESSSFDGSRPCSRN